MIRNYFYGYVLLVVFFALIVPCRAIASEAPSDEIKKAAKEGINVLVKGRQADKRLQDLGFESQSDIDNAELGEGVQIFTILPDKLLDESAPQDLQSLVFPTGQWEFMVQVGGKAKSLLTVDFVDGKWIPVGIGSSMIAKNLGSFLTKWPASSGYQYRFIRVYQGASDFIELSLKGKSVGIIPLSSLTRTPGRSMGEFNPSDLRDPKEVLSELRPSVKRHIEMWKQMKQK